MFANLIQLVHNLRCCVFTTKLQLVSPPEVISDLIFPEFTSSSLASVMQNVVVPFFQSNNFSITYADVNSAVDLGMILEDGVHPTKAGLDVISEILAEAIPAAWQFSKVISLFRTTLFQGLSLMSRMVVVYKCICV